MPYRLSERADQDVEDIAVYTIRTFGVRQAQKYQEGLKRNFEFLSENPLSARQRKAFSPPVRIHPSGAHVIV